MIYVKAISSISHQDSFRSKLALDSMKELTSEDGLISPNYKDFIPPANLRRLSPVLRMGIACSMDCREQIGAEFEGIVVGTGLGCLKDTEKFLKTIITTNTSVLSPTPFIQSTHNTIAGQISLMMKNRCYNVTHTQHEVSFEIALLDAWMLVKEGRNNVLAGGADEHIPFLESLQPDLIDDQQLTSSATLAVLSSDKTNVGLDKVVIDDIDRFNEDQSGFLASNGMDSFEKVFHFGNWDGDSANAIDCRPFAGYNQSRSGMAFNLAHDMIQSGTIKSALIVNHSDAQVGLTYLRSDEA